MNKKIQKMFFSFELTAFELVGLNTRFYWQRILFIGCQYVNKHSQDFRYYKNIIFWDDFLSDWSKNLTKLLPCRFSQSLGPFNMSVSHNCSDTRLLGIKVTPVSPVYNFRNKSTMRIILFFKVFQILSRFCKCRIKLNFFFDLEKTAFELVALKTCF